MNKYFGAAVFLIITAFFTGFAYAQTPGWAWTQQLQTEYQYAYPVHSTTDPLGNIITACRASGNCFLGYPEIPPFHSDGFRNYLWKQDSSGNTVWVKQIEEWVTVSFVGAFGAGYIYYVAGYYETVTLGNTTLTAPSVYGGYLIAKLDSAGNYLWAKDISGFTGSSFNGLWDFSTGADGSCFFTGTFRNTITFDNISLTCEGYSDMFIARMNAQGEWVWARQASGWRDVEGKFVAAGNSGQCFVAARADYDADLGEIYLPRPYDDYGWVYVANYSVTGVCLWAGYLFAPLYYQYSADIVDLVQDGLGNALALYEYYDDVLDYTALKIRKFSPGGTWSDVFTTGTLGNNRGISLAIDNSRNLYIAGSYYESFSFGGYNFNNGKGSLLIKLTSGFAVSWAYDPTPGVYSPLSQIGVTSTGTPYLTVCTYESCPIGPFTSSPGSITMSVAGLSNLGEVVWIKTSWINHIGSSGTDIYQDSGGYNYVCGNYEGAFIKDDSLYVNTGPSGNDIYVARLTNGGTMLWISTAGSSGNDEVSAIVTDSNQNSYITGSFSGTMQFGDISVSSNGDTDIFVAKIDGQGNWLWAVSFGGTGPDSGSDIALDATGNIYLTGYFSGTVSFGTELLTSNGGTDIFVAKLNSNDFSVIATRAGGVGDDNESRIALNSAGQVVVCGKYTVNGQINLWILHGESLSLLNVVIFGGATDVSVTGIAVDGAGNYYLTGYYNGSAVFGNFTLQSVGENDVFVAKLNSQLQWQWAVSGGGAGNDVANAIAVNSNGTAYLTGFANGAVSFGPYTVQPYRGKDILCAAVNSSGTWLWAKLTGSWYDYPSPRDEWGSGIAINSGGNCIVTGAFSGEVPFGTSSYGPNGAYDTFISTLINGVDNDDPVAVPVSALNVSGYPNPFKDKVTIQLDLKETTQVKAKLYNIKGELVKTLKDGVLPVGKSSLEWDGKNERQENCASGIYILKVMADRKSKTIKLIKL